MVTPPPPKLDPRASPLEHAQTLAASYRGAVERRYPELGRCYFGTRGKLENYKDYKTLLAAAEALLEQEFPPTAWMLFSIDVWLFYMGEKAKGPPTVAWAYSTARIRERADWFESEAGMYAGGQMYVGEEHKGLLAVYRQMQLELLRSRPKTSLEVCAIVDRFFPGDTFDQWVERAKREAARQQELLDVLVKKGVAW